MARDLERMLDLLAYQVREIEAVAPQPDERSLREASALGHAERLQELRIGRRLLEATEGR
jgi:DNA repair ATPase RecN